ncbi:hypothetical protein TVAG_070260 [Trichomonas vaginalis G3]|uniref:F5/8 type C domain-containing protein n=1 Tax=Trichomonas vaginalis (strain ATCC PRA-98 / G3) TaxID=412133 RepID=A2D7T0_TRIV3|nr:galactose-binding domain-like family [Trichomonas vaginalis G3]EAY23363.1 hypothetical protein TVAG_070260 [Trichomonas vaginalis G3]KAI5493778.1 galactose-binding domain-like family [Trichomonas vaginalis G3]|eukprot:XP_001584349.1 hypothetical protein [Trichomonas vaginalis G3]
MEFILFSLSRCTETNGIFKKVFNDKIVVIDASGSSKQFINGSIQLTKPENAIYPFDKDYDWCSNCASNYDDHPFITFSLLKKRFYFNLYYLKAGCCHDECCCEDALYCVQCCLFSWSLQISADNKTWTDVHKIERDYKMRRCNEKTYTLDKSYSAKFIRLIQNEPCPGDPPCIALNKMEIFGEISNEDGSEIQEDFVSYHDDDDDVSIIGHISKNGKVIVN